MTQNATGLIIAAGSSTRMDGIDKIFTPIFKRPVISYSIQAMQDCNAIKSIILVFSAENLHKGNSLVKQEDWSKVKSIIAGGERRQDSVKLGLSHVKDAVWTVIHDGSRPCVTTKILDNSLRHASTMGSAVAAVRVKDTIKIADKSLTVTQTPKRNSLWMVQTPQVFKTKILKLAHEKITKDVTDDASMIEALGGKVSLFVSEYSNVKITTSEDINVVKAFINDQQGQNL